MGVNKGPCGCQFQILLQLRSNQLGCVFTKGQDDHTTSPCLHTPAERCLGFIFNNTKTDFTVVILHVPSVQNWFRLNPTCGFPQKKKLKKLFLLVFSVFCTYQYSFLAIKQIYFTKTYIPMIYTLVFIYVQLYCQKLFLIKSFKLVPKEGKNNKICEKFMTKVCHP